MTITHQLWSAGIVAEFSAKVKPRFSLQSKAASSAHVSMILDQEEFKAGQVRLNVRGPRNTTTPDSIR
jgi:histidyl-tRNA synthetase